MGIGLGVQFTNAISSVRDPYYIQMRHRNCTILLGAYNNSTNRSGAGSHGYLRDPLKVTGYAEGRLLKKREHKSSRKSTSESRQ